MPADNEIYNQPGDIWWDEHQPLHAICTSLNPARLQYFASVFAARGMDPAGKVMIDVGCGGGLMAEEIARLGAAVIGVDPSAASIVTPAELSASLARHGLDQHDLTGMSPGISPPTLLRLLRQVKKGKLSYADFGRQAAFTLTSDMRISYLGHATKNGSYPSASPTATTSAGHTAASP
jgi:SAM-dependent methyltransferase